MTSTSVAVASGSESDRGGDDCYVCSYKSAMLQAGPAPCNVYVVCRDTYWVKVNTTTCVAEAHQMKLSHQSRMHCF